MTSRKAGSITASAELRGAPARPRLILGSASPRRRELLAQIGVTPDATSAAEIDETPRKGELPRSYVARIAAEKSQAIAGEEALVLTADTTVVVGRRILGKPASPDEAAAFLRLLSGRRHRVLTALVLRLRARSASRLVESQVRFRALSEAEINAYVASDEWRGKAGGYALQGRAAGFIPWISGSPSAIIGLPLSETAVLLRSFGYPVGATP